MRAQYLAPCGDRASEVSQRVTTSRDVIEKLSEIQENAGQLLAQLQASEHDAFAAHLYRSRREFRSACQRAGKSRKQIERCVISTFQIAQSMGFKGELRQWEELLRIGD